MSESKEMVRGTFLITISILITKVLGVLFIIPFTALIGGQATWHLLLMLMHHTI
ncbi:spore cortex protein-like protein [Staphylococcus epidermidis 36-1]|nr:spore cortex protein-like protein [Staphylococcus epidermidis 36-1]